MFDLLNGEFVPYEPMHGYFIKGGLTQKWEQMYRLDVGNLSELKMTATQRGELLEALIRYYELHLDGLGEIKSLDVLQALFHGLKE